MYKNKNIDGSLNISGRRISELRKTMKNKPSQRIFAEMMQTAGLDIDKNAVQRIESGERFITDIELRLFSQALGVSADYLLGLSDE